MSKITFIGGGNMSSCIFKGILTTRCGFDQFCIASPHLEKLAYFEKEGAHITTSNVDAFNASDVIFFGVKPQVLPDVIKELKEAKVDFGSKLCISMAAGVPLASLIKVTGCEHFIRIMPNTPSKVRLGVTSVCAAPAVTKEEIELCHELLEGLGMIVDTDEQGINTLGAIAGSGPAFIYRMMESMVSEIERAGFSKAVARKMAEQVFLGTTQMVIHNQQDEISTLREAVTSKGGTTYEGLQQMTAYKFEDMMSDVVKACLKRTSELEELFASKL